MISCCLPDSLCRKLFTKHNSLGREQEIAEAKYDGQSLQEAKISGLVYTLCTCACMVIDWLGRRHRMGNCYYCRDYTLRPRYLYTLSGKSDGYAPDIFYIICLLEVGIQILPNL